SSDSEQEVLADKLVELEEELHIAHEAKNDAQQVMSLAEEDFKIVRAAIVKLEEKVKNLQRNREEVGNVISSIKDRMNELKLQLNSIKERLMIEFGLEIDDVIDKESTMSLSREELEEKVDRLKNRLDNYGEINPMAVQAYDEMKARYEFIHGQKSDLEEAKTMLMETISEIDSSAEEKFMTAYTQVRLNFMEVFKTLFRPDDNCDLVLADPENPLDSKINILAQPKGKRPQVIDQLSGGEKTLTAMALLFALYLLKPAPFCVLDEVDAPLDDANINKYNEMIRKFSDKSQFIIVTHNKRTMAQVDSIYGVTMQEEGISKVVPVDFQQWEATA
ncbi:MAG: chromosome segregation protein, partial [Limisphaerales bacterium]